MGLFEELTVPGRFNRLRKYFKGLEMNDLDPNYHYSSLVADVDKLIMQVFCDKYICTPDHKFIRRVLNQDDIGEENLEETIRTFEILLKKRDEDLERLQDELEREEKTIKGLRIMIAQKDKQLEELTACLEETQAKLHDLQFEAAAKETGQMTFGEKEGMTVHGEAPPHVPGRMTFGEMLAKKATPEPSH